MTDPTPDRGLAGIDIEEVARACREIGQSMRPSAEDVLAAARDLVRPNRAVFIDEADDILEDVLDWLRADHN